MDHLAPFLADVQTGVLRSIDPQVVSYLFFEITDPEAFRRSLPSRGLPQNPWLHGKGWEAHFDSERDRIDFDNKKREEKSLEAEKASPQRPIGIFANIAFTFTGLQRLGVDTGTLATFPESFREGMAYRAELLGDQGDAAPECWDGYLGSRQIHGVLWFNLKTVARDAKTILDLARLLPSEAADARRSKFVGFNGVEVLHVEQGTANYTSEFGGGPRSVEHFGFRDGVSQPYVDLGLDPPPPGGGTPRANGSWAPVATGEILLGQPDEDWRVQHLPANALLSHNSSFMAFRKLEQDVVGFRNFLKRRSPAIPQALGAQMVGRWPDGAPLVKYPDGPEQFASVGSSINDFRYQRDDPFGRRCPIGAHIRRANPRDTNDRDEARRHRLFRRGISYGGPLLPKDSSGDGRARGLLFVTMQARLDRQFEFVQANWLNRGEFEGQAGAGIDPITGRHRGGLEDAFQPAGGVGPVTGLRRFVTTRGGEYFFIPSFAALAALKNGETFKAIDPEAPTPKDAIGSIAPAETDNSQQLIDIGMGLLSSADSYYSLGTIETTPYPGGRPKPVSAIVVGRYKYVSDVLNDDANFSTHTLGERVLEITGGQRLLIGMSCGDPERDKRLAVLHAALRRLQPPDVFALADGLSKEALRRVQPLGKLDVVGDFGRVIPILCAGALFGVHGPDYVSATGAATIFGRVDITDTQDDWLRSLPTVEDYEKPILSMQTWTRLSFLQIFVNSVNAQEIVQAAERATRELLRQIDSLVTQARQMYQARPKSDPRNLLEALVRVSLDPTDGPDPGRHIRLILGEFAAGSVETVNAALANIFDYLLDHKEKVRTALCAKMGEAKDTPFESLMSKLREDPTSPAHQDVLDRLILEILRFRPMGPIAFRYCESDNAQIGSTPVEKGANVILIPASAMVDPKAFPEPFEIKFDRDRDLYLHFGAGCHACGGERNDNPISYHIALPMLRALFVNLASLPGLRRAAGPKGGVARTFPIVADALVMRFAPS